MWNSYDVKRLIDIPRFYTLFKRHRDYQYSFEGETHNFWECLYIENGRLRVTSDERIYELDSGNIVFHKPLELHKYDVLSGDGTDILVFSFDLDGELCDFFEEKVFDLNLYQREIISRVSKYIDSVIKNNEAYYKKEKHVLDILQDLPALMQQIAEYIRLLLLEVYTNHQTADLNKTADSLIFKNLVCCMKENMKDAVTIKDISDRFYISQSTIKRIFRKNAGMGVHAYFLKLRIAESAKYLKNGASVNETALEFGFKNASYFSTAFKREMGMTPSEYIVHY